MTTQNLLTLLQNHPYPGRGIVLGRSADDQKAVIAYFIMGRSENSRNRVFEATEDGIRTRAFDESKMTDPSLIIYHPVRVYQGKTIVTNGDQTDSIRDALREGHCYRHALAAREFEPDGPNYTPRISGVVKPNGAYNLSILKSLDGDPACCCRYFYEYDRPAAGVGHFIHTYQENREPLPSFEGEPRRVSLFVRYLNLADGSADDCIINKHSC